MTSYLLKNITVLDNTSEHNGKKVNVLIENGKIAKIGAAVEDAALEIIDFSGSYLAPGFCDLY
ncbi:MAG TPA: hypothetical protein PK546_08980, partial [Chitinophagales bacterium]|nr:hypothetical protein [Chitinophagales bacterium]